MDDVFIVATVSAERLGAMVIEFVWFPMVSRRFCFAL